MKIILTATEITELMIKRAKQIGEDCCADDQRVLDVALPYLPYDAKITIEIGVAPVAEEQKEVTE